MFERIRLNAAEPVAHTPQLSTPPNVPPSGFRTDINGLRAIAVTLVVLFHFGLPGLTGGFVGVDVFFVISGYLMTRIIVSRQEQGRLKLLDFYTDRCRRIIPALMVVCLVLLIVGALVMMPRDFMSLGSQVITSLTFTSNVLFWRDTGYFQQDAHDLWLLHTWSLSVEWQFYLLYPIALMLLARYLPAQRWRWLVLLGALISFSVSLIASHLWQNSAFYLLPTRAWEMLAGGIVFLFPVRIASRWRWIAAWSGLGLIALAAVWATPGMPWPGYMALLPVAGATLFIAAQSERCWIVQNTLAQFLGRTSYSIYLWHWPFAAWLTYLSVESDPAWVGSFVIASVGLGYLSYRFVELPALSPAGFIRRSAPTIKLGTAFAILAAGMLVITTNGLPGRLPPELRAATYQLAMPSVTNGWCFYSVESIETLPIGPRGQACHLGDFKGRRNALLIGDSFAGHYGPFWDDVGKRASLNIHSVSSDWCFPSTTDEFTGPKTGRGYTQCLKNREFLRTNADRYDVVIFGGSWGVIDTQNKLEGVFRAIADAAGKAPLVVVMPAPTNFDVNIADRYARTMLFDLPFDISRFSKERDKASRVANQKLERLASRYPNVMFLARASLFNIDGKPSDVTTENIPFGLDTSGHLSIYGSRQSAIAFMGTPAYRTFRSRVRELE